MDLSERTIRTELKNLNKNSDKQGFKIKSIRGKGYALDIIDKEKFKMFNSLLSNEENLDNSCSPEARVNKIVEILLVTNKRVTIEFISEKLGYSRSTVIKDLEFAEKKIAGLNLNLERKANKGLRLNNNEISIRKSLSVYLYNSNSNNTNFIIQSEKNNKMFSKIKKIFIEEVLVKNIEISNLAIENIFCHLKILILRINNQSFLKDDVAIEVVDNKFLDVSKKICRYIGTEIDSDIPDVEFRYLAAQICYKSKMILEENEVKFRAKVDVEEILEQIDSKFYTNFKSDKELIDSLIIHLCALISRARANTQLKNPYFDEVNTRYSAIVSIVVNFTDEFCRRWNLKLLKDEIAFITIHFATHFEKAKLKSLKGVKKIALVCPSDGGMQYLLKIRLEESFRNAIIDGYSPLQVGEIVNREYEFLITDRDLSFNNKKVKVFKMKNLFDEKEIQEVVEKIEALKEKTRLEVLDGIIFKKMIGGKDIDYLKFLEQEAKKLTCIGICNENFASCVLKREEILSTAYQSNIAAPHGIEMDAFENFLSVIIFDNMIDWGDKKVKAVFLMAMKKGTLQLHKKLSDKIFNLINDNDKRAVLYSLKNKEEFVHFFESI